MNIYVFLVLTIAGSLLGCLLGHIVYNIFWRG